MSSPANPSDNPAGPTDTSSAYTRLHITPFDQDLVKVIIPSGTLPKARNISYHTIETFPDKRYGFVELPDTEAEKIKKRLNGAVLKGAKMKIEKARPEQNYLPVPGEEDLGKKKRKKSKEEEEGTKKKRKRDHNVVEGVELRDRKVKRGWTVPEEAKIREKKSKKEKGEKKEKKDKTKRREERSKYTDREECLLKTKLPVKLSATKPADGDEEEPEKKKRKKKSREVVIHEFEKTTKFPTFLKATKPAPAEALTTEFVEGKGWVDAEGNVIEPEKIRKTATAPVPESEAPKKKKKPAKAPTPPPQDDTTSSSGTSSEEDASSDETSDEEEEEVKAKTVTPAKKAPEVSKPTPQPVEDDTTSSSGTSSDEDSAEDSDDEMKDADKPSAPALIDSPLAALKAADASRPRSSGSNVSLTIKIPPTTPAKVHPLEALYKRPKPDSNSTPQPAKEAEPFSFFGGGGDNDDIEEDVAAPAMPQLPMTPFTEQEFAWRNVRSAAPTPDTAFPGRTKPFWAIGSQGDEEDEEDEAATQQEIEATLNAEQNAVEGEGAGNGVPPGEFQKWFWENRRNLNQSWMKRRKTAAKEKRHRDNKSRASKAV